MLCGIRLGILIDAVYELLRSQAPLTLQPLPQQHHNNTLFCRYARWFQQLGHTDAEPLGQCLDLINTDGCVMSFGVLQGISGNTADPGQVLAREFLY